MDNLESAVKILQEEVSKLRAENRELDRSRSNLTAQMAAIDLICDLRKERMQLLDRKRSIQRQVEAMQRCIDEFE